MKILMDAESIKNDEFCDVTLNLDTDFENNRIGFAFIRKDADKYTVIKSGVFKVYDEED